MRVSVLYVSVAQSGVRLLDLHPVLKCQMQQLGLCFAAGGGAEEWGGGGICDCRR